LNILLWVWVIIFKNVQDIKIFIKFALITQNFLGSSVHALKIWQLLYQYNYKIYHHYILYILHCSVSFLRSSRVVKMCLVQKKLREISRSCIINIWKTSNSQLLHILYWKVMCPWCKKFYAQYERYRKSYQQKLYHVFLHCILSRVNNLLFTLDIILLWMKSKVDDSWQVLYYRTGVRDGWYISTRCVLQC